MRLASRVAPAALAVAALLLGVLPAQAQADPDRAPDRAPDRVTVGDRTFIADGQGRALQWRGFNLADKSSRGTNAFADIHESDLKGMAARGFNLARLAFFWDDLEPTPGHYDRGYLTKMRRILDWANRYHIKVILDAHQDVYGPHFGSRGVPDWATRDEGLPFWPIPDDWFSEYFEPSVQTAFDHLYKDADLRAAHARMWMTVASALGRHPALLGYDLMNEPFAKFLEGEDLPAAAARFEATELTELWNRLAQAIRLVDHRSWVFVEPTVIVGVGVPTQMGHIDDPHMRLRAALLRDRDGNRRRLRPQRHLHSSLRGRDQRLPDPSPHAGDRGGVGRQPLRSARKPVRHRHDGLLGPLRQWLDVVAVVPGRRLLLPRPDGRRQAQRPAARPAVRAGRRGRPAQVRVRAGLHAPTRSPSAPATTQRDPPGSPFPGTRTQAATASISKATRPVGTNTARPSP